MKKFRNHIILLFALALFSFPCQAQELQSQKIILARLKNATDTMTLGFKSGAYGWIVPRKMDQNYINHSIEQSNIAKDVILYFGKRKFDFDPAFLESLNYDIENFEEFLYWTEILPKKKETRIPLSKLVGVYTSSQNLKLKAELLENHKIDRVEVKVHTIDKKGKKVQKCWVYYTPYLKDDDQHKVKFDQISTPTTDLIPPGKKYIWTEKNGKKGPKTIFICGDDGRAKREIDLEAPDK
jgi:hypothetical protein